MVSLSQARDYVTDPFMASQSGEIKKTHKYKSVCSGHAFGFHNTTLSEPDYYKPSMDGFKNILGIN